MRSLEATAVISIVLLSALSAQSAPEREVLALQKEYESAIERRDASVHERLFADDYTYTPGNGAFMDRERHMAFTRSGALAVGSFESTEQKVRIYGDTAIVTGRWILKGARGGKPLENQIRYLTVYVRRGGHWQIVAEQRTGIRE
jgi:ketosteroid isomerase-like protein